MLNTIEEAAKNFCIHQVGVSCEPTDKITNDKTYTAYIDITTPDAKKYKVYLALAKTSIQKIATLFLEEDQSDDETLKDMMLETTNLIVGSAKVIAENANKPYNIGTPFFQNINKFDFDFDEIKTLSMDGNSFIIAIKELDV